MKTLILLFFISTLNLSIPKDIKIGERMSVIEKNYPTYHFKFYKKITESGYSIGMLGYWKGKEGCVLHFSKDSLTSIATFDNFKEYKEYITNPEEVKNIVLNDKNLMLTSNE